MVTVTRQQKGKRRFYMVEGDQQVAGIELPSVTTITGVLDKPALVPWAERTGIEEMRSRVVAAYPDLMLEPMGQAYFEESLNKIAKDSSGATRRIKEDAAEFGTTSHEVIEGILAGREASHIPDTHLDVANNFASWYRGSGLTNIEFAEQAVYSAQYQYGGTIDAIGYDSNGYTVIIDWKTSNGLYPEVALQLAGYGVAYAEMHNNQPSFTSIRLIAVRLGKDRPEFEAIEIPDNTASFNGFLGCMAIRQFNGSNPLGKNKR